MANVTAVHGFVRALLDNTSGFPIGRFLKEYSRTIGAEFPYKMVLGEVEIENEEMIESLAARALEKLGCILEKRLRWYDYGKAKDCIFVTGVKDANGRLCTRQRPRADSDWCQGPAKPNGRFEEARSYQHKWQPQEKPASIQPVQPRASDVPFLLNSYVSKELDLVTKLRNRSPSYAHSATVQTKPRAKIAQPIKVAEYPPETMQRSFLKTVSGAFQFDCRANSTFYYDQRDELPDIFFMRVTHIENDGFRMWGRITQNDDDLDQLQFVSNMINIGSIDGDVMDSDCALGDNAGSSILVMVFHQELWCRGWVSKTHADANGMEVMADVFLPDFGLTVMKPFTEIGQLKTMLSNGDIVALPFFLKGCQRSNRGPDFLRDEILNKIVRVGKCSRSLTEQSGECVTPIYVWKDIEEHISIDNYLVDLPSLRSTPASSASSIAEDDGFVEGDASGPAITEEESRDIQRDLDPSAVFEKWSPPVSHSLNAYHGEDGVEETTADAVRRSLIAVCAELRLNSLKLLVHQAANSRALLDAMEKHGDWLQKCQQRLADDELIRIAAKREAEVTFEEREGEEAEVEVPEQVIPKPLVPERVVLEIPAKTRQAKEVDGKDEKLELRKDTPPNENHMSPVNKGPNPGRSSEISFEDLDSDPDVIVEDDSDSAIDD